MQFSSFGSQTGKAGVPSYAAVSAWVSASVDGSDFANGTVATWVVTSPSDGHIQPYRISWSLAPKGAIHANFSRQAFIDNLKLVAKVRARFSRPVRRPHTQVFKTASKLVRSSLEPSIANLENQAASEVSYGKVGIDLIGLEWRKLLAANSTKSVKLALGSSAAIEFSTTAFVLKSGSNHGSKTNEN